ncbi:MAG: DMT family transporter [Clostridia bacterium]|nr:DMT family transporter [Clostridia bacterium]
MDSSKLGTIYVLASATGFGLMAIFALYAYQTGANVVTVLFFRFFIAALLMWCYWGWKQTFPMVDKRDLYYLIGLGIIGYGSMAGLYFSALNYIPASLTAMLLYTYPVIVTGLAVLLKDEVFELKKGLALGLSLIGLIMILGTSFGGFSVFGIALGLGAAIFYSGYIIVGNRVLKKVSFWVASTYVISSAAVFYFAAGISTGSFIINIGGVGWVAIFAIAIFSTIVAISGFFAGINLIGPSKASIISTFEPIITVAAAAMFFNEMLTLFQFLGGLLILFSVILLQLGKPEKDTKDTIAINSASEQTPG